MSTSSQSGHPRLAVINVVGMCRRHLGDDTPFLRSFAERENNAALVIEPLLPAVTSTMQATFLTGLTPGEHGIVANYWFDRQYAEHRGWKQSDRLVTGEKIWERLRREVPGYTCAKVFWWNNLYSTVDYSITPRPVYCADGKKIFDIQTWPMNLRGQIKADLGEFPFPAFWGPMAGLASSKWIADSACWIEEKFSPDLNLIYLPHLDYNLQRLGPDDPEIGLDLREIDLVAGDLVRFFEKRGVESVILSEYGITPVGRVIHLNRIFREKGWICCRDELGRDQIDPGNCRALAVADHQVAHIYAADAGIKNQVRSVVENLEGVARVLEGATLQEAGLGHDRSGDLVAVSEEDAWFSYYYWDDDSRAPDYARTVDIHRKPGYDPAELFLDPEIVFPKLKIAGKLVGKRLGFRTLMNVIPLNADLVKGSHGCIPRSEDDYPLLIGQFHEMNDSTKIGASEVYDQLRQRVLNPSS